MCQEAPQCRLVPPGPAGAIEVGWHRQVDIGQQAGREGQSQPQQRANGQLLHRSTQWGMFISVHSSWTSKPHQEKRQLCLLKADLSIYIKLLQNTMLNLLITEDY